MSKKNTINNLNKLEELEDIVRENTKFLREFLQF